MLNGLSNVLGFKELIGVLIKNFSQFAGARVKLLGFGFGGFFLID